MYRQSVFEQQLNQILTDFDKHSTADNLQIFQEFLSTAMSTGHNNNTKFKGDVSLNRSIAPFDPTVLYKLLPAILTRIFMTERTPNDEKYPCLLDMLDCSL